MLWNICVYFDMQNIRCDFMDLPKKITIVFAKLTLPWNGYLCEGKCIRENIYLGHASSHIIPEWFWGGKCKNTSCLRPSSRHFSLLFARTVLMISLSEMAQKAWSMAWCLCVAQTVYNLFFVLVTSLHSCYFHCSQGIWQQTRTKNYLMHACLLEYMGF